MKRPTVFWRLYPGDENEPTRRRRGLMVCAGLRRLGWDVHNEAPDGCDIAVIQRIAQPNDMASHKVAGRIAIFDQNDDLLSKGSRFHLPTEAATVASADYVVVGCRYMQRLYARINRRVLVIPDMLEDEHWTTSRVDLPDSPLVLSWVGMSDNLQYVEPIVLELAGIKDLRLRIVTTELDSRRCNNRERVAAWPIPSDFVTWRMDTFISEMSKAHVGFVPLPDTSFARSKGPHKSVAFGALGLPVIASDMPGYREVIRHGETGLLADSPEEFRACIEQLRDPELRERLGQAGRSFSKFFTGAAVSKLWEKLIWSVWKERGS